MNELEKIVKNIQTIKRLPASKVTNNNIVIDTVHDVDMTHFLDHLNSKKIKSVMIPTTLEYERRLKDLGREYIDIYKLFPAMEIMMDGFVFYDVELQKKVDTKTIDKYDCFILYQSTSMNIILREFISLFFRTYYPNKILVHVYDSGAFIGSSNRLFEGLELRPMFVLNKEMNKLPDFSSSLGYLSNRIRAGKYELLTVQTPATDAYEFKTVKNSEFMRKFSIEELMSYRKDNKFGIPQFFCSNKNLASFTRMIREQLGYHNSILPRVGEELIAYNDFRTNNISDNIVVKKGKTMTFSRMLSPGIFEVSIDDKLYNIVVDINVFSNVLERELMGPDRYILDPTLAHVFYSYALTSSMFDHVSCNSIIAYVDSIISTSYLYSLLKSARKNITILIDSTVVNTKLI